MLPIFPLLGFYSLRRCPQPIGQSRPRPSKAKRASGFIGKTTQVRWRRGRMYVEAQIARREDCGPESRGG
ncbi:hypothetical protein ES332_D10G177500v1 [Gossypium tomentosum]|uniref:Uncharacterized protein n=1 Tax=Gossypium tomentosum TaxID=34277 RepID=A0A5D2J6A7_GOSTO|nr:hypothetical protein ES332_D10G177500v1 [Gossypium tomentosum]